MTLDSIANLLGASIYAAHSLCLTNDPFMVEIFVLTHVVTTLSYTVIGIILVFDQGSAIRAMVRHRMAFGAFILLCGLSHLANAMTFYAGIYRLEAVVMLATAGVSLTTAALTFSEQWSGR